MFIRPEHNKIATLLSGMASQTLAKNSCYFGGGTAIVLLHGEYRLSLDVDFLCSDIDGYRNLRSLVFDNDVASLFGPDVEVLREFRSDQYGIRGLIALGEQSIKFEIVRESRIPLTGSINAKLGVPVLSENHMFAEKLLANTDRGTDRGAAYRDAIDLGFLLIGHNGTFPKKAVELAERAYGTGIRTGVERVLHQLHAGNEIEHALNALQMNRDDVTQAVSALQQAFVMWPTIEKDNDLSSAANSRP